MSCGSNESSDTVASFGRGQATPAGYERVTPAPGVTMLVVRGLDAPALAARVLEPPADALVRHFGRAGLHALPLDDGGCALVRSYRHGGVLRGLTRGWFVSRPPRPFVELTITASARARGVATPEVLAAVVAHGFGPWYRGWLVTREIAGARNLWDALRENLSGYETKGLLLRRVGRALRLMHGRGVEHGDLNLRNILVLDGSVRPDVYIIDLDKARLWRGAVSAVRAHANLRRLLRSINKLDPERVHVRLSDWNSLLEGYDGHG